MRCASVAVVVVDDSVEDVAVVLQRTACTSVVVVDVLSMTPLLLAIVVFPFRAQLL